MSQLPTLALASSTITVPVLSVVVPCFNESESLRMLYDRVTKVCVDLGVTYEFVMINDGSSDDTWHQMRALADADPHVVAVNLSRNHGHQMALTAGLSLCAGQRILVIDADLQDPPELAPQMMQMMDEGVDVVYGQRRRRKGETWFKLFTASLFYRLLDKMTNIRIPRDTGDFRLISRRALNVLMSMPERHRFIRGMVSWVGFRQEPLLYDRDQRVAGETKYPFRKMLKLAIDAMTSFSSKPLALAGYLAMFSGLFAIGVLAYAVISWWAGSTVSGWTSVVAIIALFSASQFMILAIMGEYLGRIFEQIKGRPIFIIESVYRAQTTDQLSIAQ